VDDNEGELIEKEGKIKALQLRLRGQLHTIKSLEAQLVEAQEVIDAKSKLTLQLNNKLKYTSDQVNRQDIHVKHVDNSKWMELVDSLKVGCCM
jgi:uncharacterized coiled-coil protein SlyX